MSKEVLGFEIDQIIKFEQGELERDEIISLFQDLVNNGLAWQLQGSYGRQAQALIDQGLITNNERNK